jgi:hypothetical protein
MIGKSKALGLTFLVITALSTVPSAQAGEFDIGANPAVITGHSELKQIFAVKFTLTKTDGSKTEGSCNTTSFEGTTQGQTISEATLTPTYGNPQETSTGCIFFSAAFGNTQFQMNGCKYTITGAGQIANTAVVDIVACTAGKQIQLKGSNCTLDIPEQNGLSHVVSKNIESNEVTMEWTLTGIKSTQTGAACPDGNNHQSANLSLTTSMFVKAFNDEGSKQVAKHGHQYAEYLCGQQVSFVST